MMRLAGFVLGVVLILAGLTLADWRWFDAANKAQRQQKTLATGEPDAPEAGPAQVDAAAPGLAVTRAAIDTARTASLPDTSGLASASLPGDVDGALIQPTGFFEEDTAPLAAPPLLPDPPAQRQQSTDADVVTLTPVHPVGAEQVQSRQWQPVWQAFSARRSAQGFAARLERLTGLEYRVDRQAAGQYQVAFSYGSDDERAQALSRIEQTTGLVLAGVNGNER